MKPQDANLQEALRIAQETMTKCDAFYGESNDDSCRHIYARIKDMLKEQQEMVERELASHREKGTPTA